ncbi:MAG: hypothetical protein AAB442_02725 [Patescibacteria group bacterium]
MPGQPLQPFAPPNMILGNLPGGLTSGMLITWGWYAVCAFWVVYTLVAIYHWIKYSHASWVMVPAIALHLLVSSSLIVYAFTGIWYL